jgi:hypothetical protein
MLISQLIIISRQAVGVQGGGGEGRRQVTQREKQLPNISTSKVTLINLNFSLHKV